MSDGLLHHRGVVGDPLQAPVSHRARGAAGFDGLGQQPLHALFADPLAPAGERGGIDRRAMLKEGLAGEVLVIRVLDPACDHRLVGEPEGVLEIEQPRHQPRRGCRPARRGREEAGPLALEELPVDQRRELHQLMTHVDQVDEPWREKIILLGRGEAVLHQAAEIAGFWPQSYETLHEKSTETSAFHCQIRRFAVVRAGLCSFSGVPRAEPRPTLPESPRTWFGCRITGCPR